MIKLGYDVQGRRAELTARFTVIAGHFVTKQPTENAQASSEQTIHVRFIDDRMSGASVVDGPVRKVAMDTIRDVVERQGHPTRRVSRTWAIGDPYEWAEAVYEGTVTLSNGDSAAWRHVFTKASDPWPMMAEPAAEPLAGRPNWIATTLERSERPWAADS